MAKEKQKDGKLKSWATAKVDSVKAWYNRDENFLRVVRFPGTKVPLMDVLIDFVKTGKLPVVMKQGLLTEDQMNKGLTESKAAAIVNSGDQAAIVANGLEGFRRDTIWVSLQDSLYNYEGFVADSMRYIPFSEGDTFEIIACPNTTRSGSIIQVMECNAPDSSFLKGMGKAGKRLIYNRNEEANAKGAYAGLKIGDAGNNWNNNAGNWE